MLKRGSKSQLSRRYFVVLGLIWMGIIFLASSRSSVPTPVVFEGQDKFMHALTYAVLALLWARAGWSEGASFQWKRIFGVTILCALYGITDEVHQMYVPGRDASIEDWIADTVGAFLGAFLFYRRYGFRRDS